MAEIFADVVANIRADSSGLRAELLASEQATVKSANAIQATLDRVKTQTRNPFTGQFSRQVDLPNMGRLMAADAEFAAQASKKLEVHSASAKDSIRALHGSLFLVTGQTGFFAVEALRAASHIGKLTTAAGASTVAVGGMSAAFAALKVQVVSLYTYLLANPVFLALAAAAAAYGTATHFLNKSLEESEAKEKALTEAYEKEKPSLDALMKSRWAASVALGQMAEKDRKEREMLLADPNMKPSTAAAIIDNQSIVEREKANADLVAKHKDRLREQATAADEEAAVVQKGNMERRAQFETDEMRKRIAEEKKAEQDLADFVASRNAGSAAIVARRNEAAFGAALDSQNGQKTTGATFGIRAQSFRGNAPSGVFGEQREQEKITKAVKELTEIQKTALKFLQNLVPSFGISD